MMSKGILKAATYSEAVDVDRYQHYMYHTTGDEI
jgi:hypothetical protein